MTYQELVDLINTNLTRVGTNRVSAPEIKQVCQALLDFAAAIDNEDAIPTWTNLLTFQLDGTGAGKYCKHPDVNGKLRIFETKIANNTGNEPPTDPNTIENASWKEISASAGSGIQEWAPGLYGEGLVIVYYTHPLEGGGLYLLLEPIRPFNSANIELEITQAKWQKLNTSSQNVEVVSVDAGVLTLNMQNYRDKYFRLLPADGADADFTIAFANVPPNGSYIMLEIVRSTNVNRFITFPVGANMVNSDQNLDNGGSAMEVGGTDSSVGKRRYHYIGILLTQPEANQKYIVNMQSSRSFVP